MLPTLAGVEPSTSNWATEAGLDQLAHLHSLIRVFVVHMKKLCIPDNPKCTQWRFWSDYVNVQADLNLCWAYISEGTFSDIAGYHFLGLAYKLYAPANNTSV